MLSDQRRAQILELLAQKASSISALELSQQFNVSTMTIRRDLDMLEARNQIRRVHGGAILYREDTGKPFFHRQPEFNEEKRAIGELAASLVDDDETILFDAGTTTLATVTALVASLEGKVGCLKKLTVITHALPLAQELCACENVQVILLGGVLKRKEQCAVGSTVVQALSRFSVDKLFLSAAGIDLERGLTDPDLMEAEVKQAMIHSAGKVIVVADSSKWGTVHLVQIAPWSSIHTLVSDRGLPESARQEIEARGIQVLTPKEL